jgi:DNA polymerase III alpha subunit
MHRLPNREIDDTGTVHYTDQGLIDFLYSGNLFEDAIADFGETDEINLYNKWAEYFHIPTIKSGEYKSDFTWDIPQEYKSIDLDSFFLSKCKTKEEIDRVTLELTLFLEHGMEETLRFLIFLVDFMNQNDIVYGVGRGSSVASFCLYLIGLHQIDSIKYQLPIEEFLR